MKISVVIIVVALAVSVSSFALCEREKGPKLCNEKLYAHITKLCDTMSKQASENHALPRCCCSFGCTDKFLKKKLCPE